MIKIDFDHPQISALPAKMSKLLGRTQWSGFQSNPSIISMII